LKYLNSMIRLVYFAIGLLIFQGAIFGQPLVGMKKADIISYMKQNEPNFALDNAMVNKKYVYLKFYDKDNEETILCFLTDNNICNLVRRMSDYSNLNPTIKKLDKEYKKIDKDKWSYTINKDEYVIELKREKWYFTLETRIKK
jgi:hypothetical protein